MSCDMRCDKGKILSKAYRQLVRTAAIPETDAMLLASLHSHDEIERRLVDIAGGLNQAEMICDLLHDIREGTDGR